MSIEYSKSNGIATISFNRPPANAYDKEMLVSFYNAVDQVANDPEVRIAIVKSANPKFFCTGADISVLQSSSPAEFANFLMTAQKSLDAITRTPKLFVAAISGHCIGGGLEIALACDIRVASKGKYKFGLAEVNLGLSPGMGGTQRLPRLIGKSRALSLMVTGDSVGPDEALTLGMIDKLYDEDGFESQLMEYVTKLSKGPSMAQGYIKLSVNQGLEVSIDQGLAMERSHQNQLFVSEDVKEGLKAFLEKRPANYSGK